MNEKLKSFMREVIKARYDMDIDEATVHFSTQNYAFVFDQKPYMIRVSMTAAKTRREILSEMLWIDDLKQFKEAICEPSPSLCGNLMEEFTFEDIVYRAGMFRTARGSVKAVDEMDPMFFICVGDLLGTIHKVSTDERINGIKYQRKTLGELFADIKELAFPSMPPEERERIEWIEAKVNALPCEAGNYGIAHCDFHNDNFFVEGNNIWLFDFDACAYTHYLYDVASFVLDCLLKGYKSDTADVREVVYHYILPYFRIGYELSKGTSEKYWEHLELFISYRAAAASMALTQIETCGMVDDLRAIKDFFNFILIADDPLTALSEVRRANG